MSRKKLLMTGSTGFIGKAFIQTCSKQYKIYAAARKESLEKLPASVERIELDLSTDFSMEHLPSDIDVILHLAQSNRFREFPEQATDIFGVNAAATLKLAVYGKKVGIKKFILASTGSVYAPSENILTEESILAGANAYVLSKKQAEESLELFKNFFEIGLARIFFPYGPGQENKLMPGLIQSVRKGKPITLAGQEGLRINPLYIGDMVEALRLMIEKEGSGIFNIAGAESLSLRDVGSTIGRVLGIEPQFEMKEGSQPALLAGISKAQLILGWAPKVSFEEGVRRTIEAESPTLS